MYKKFFSRILIFSLLVLSACASRPTGVTGNIEQAKKVVLPELTFDYPYSEVQIKSFTENDTADVIESAGPYYTGAVGYDQPVLKDLQQAKREFVNVLNLQTDDLFASAKQYSDSLNALQDKYVDYVGNVLEFDKKFKDQSKELAASVIEGKVMATSLIVQYESIDPVTSSEAAKAFLEYQKTLLAQNLVLVLTDSTVQTVSGLLTLSDFFNGSTDVQLKTVGSELEWQIPSMVDSLGKQLVVLQDKNLALETGLKQLNTAERLIGLGSVEFIANQMPEIETKIAALTPGDTLKKEDIEFMKSYGEVFKQFSADLSTRLKNVDSSELLSSQQIAMLLPRPGDLIVPVAVAQEGGYLKQGFDLLKSGASKTAEVAGKAGSFAWDGLKTTLKGARTATGVTLDTLGAATKSGFDIAFGAANGNSTLEIAGEIGKNFKQIGENYDKGISGSETLKTAQGYFDDVEKAGGDALSGAVEKTVGKGWTSWMAGHIGTMTVNMFTGFGKGITKVADPQSTTGTIIEGALDIGLSFIGGSKVIASGSQIASGAKESLKAIGKKGINFIEKVLAGNEVKSLKNISADILKNAKLTPEGVKTLLSNALNIELKEGLKEEIIAAGKKINQKFLDLLRSGASTILENATVGAKQAYKEFVKQAFENSLKGYKDALINVLGGSFKGYVDNLVASKADDLLKGVIKDYVDKGIIQGVGGAFDGVYTGLFDGSAISPIKITIADESVMGDAHSRDVEELAFAIVTQTSGSPWRKVPSGEINPGWLGYQYSEMTVKISGTVTNISSDAILLKGEMNGTIKGTFKFGIKTKEMAAEQGGSSPISGTVTGTVENGTMKVILNIPNLIGGGNTQVPVTLTKQ